MTRTEHRRFVDRLRRAFASSDVLDAEQARDEARTHGYDTVADITDRRKVRLLGFVSSMVVHPRSAAPSVEVDVTDGTGTITVIWLGREKISGIEPGTRLSIAGFAAVRGHHRVLYNPRYEILGRPGEESA